MRAAAGYPVVRARSSIVSDRLTDIWRDVRAGRVTARRRVTVEPLGETFVIRFGQYELVTVYRDDAELEGFVTHRVIAQDALALEWQQRLQLAIDGLSVAAAPPTP